MLEKYDPGLVACNQGAQMWVKIYHLFLCDGNLMRATQLLPGYVQSILDLDLLQRDFVFS
jgi:hypothetical protein